MSAALPANNAGLCFTGSIDELTACDLLLFAGAMHFIPDSFEVLGASSKSLPQYVLLNECRLVISRMKRP